MTDEQLTEEEKKARKKAERERKRQEARENAEKKKKFGLTPEKKRKLKLLIMKIAQEQLEEEQRLKALQKQKYLDDNVKPLPDINSLNEAQLVALCKDLHKQIADAEEVKYDAEIKIRMKDYDLNEMTIKLNDVKGKFIKPALKKVSKTANKLAKMEAMKEAADAAPSFKVALKSTGKDKFALPDEEEEKPDFRANLHHDE
jgi:hypothetical protein